MGTIFLVYICMSVGMYVCMYVCSLVATGKIASFLLHLCDDVIVQIPGIAMATGRVAFAAA